MKPRLLALAGRALAVLAWTAVTAGPVQAKRHALLIGVGQYDNPVSALLAPPFDVDGVEQALLEHWGFQPDDIHKVLDGDATKAGILGALRQLEVSSEPGDFIFIYYAGHGTSALDISLAAALPHTSGALIPADFDKDGSAEHISSTLVVGRRDIRPILENLDRNGRKVFFAVDACYSGNTVRGNFAEEAGIPPLKVRAAELIPPEALAEATRKAADTEPDPYPYEQVFYLSAAGEHEPAGEIDEELLKWYPTHDGKPHGAFTDALLRAMKGLNPGTDANGDGNVSYLELFNSVRGFMDQRGYQQTPQFLPTMDEAAVDLTRTVVFDAPGAIESLAKTTESRPVRLRLMNPTGGDLERLERIRHLETVDQGADLILLREEGETRLLNGSGDLVLADPDPTAESAWERIRAEVWLSLLADGIGGKASLTLQFSGDAMGATAVQGDSVGLNISIDRPAHLVVFDLNARGGISLLYPYFDQELDRLAAGEVAQIPDSVVVPPFGVDKIVALAYASPVSGLHRYLRQTVEPGQEGLEAFKQLLAGQGDALAMAHLQLVTAASANRSGDRQGPTRGEGDAPAGGETGGD